MQDIKSDYQKFTDQPEQNYQNDTQEKSLDFKCINNQSEIDDKFIDKNENIKEEIKIVYENSEQLQIQQIITNYRQRPIIKYMFLAGIICSGLMYYNNNFQGILKEYILEKTGIDQRKFQLFEVLSNGPIIPLMLFCGPVNDILGLRNGMVIYYFTMALGVWIAAIGGYKNSFNYLLVGKILNLIGIAMGIVAKSSLLAKWFKGGNLAMYNSLYLALTKLTQFSASLLYTRIYEYYDSLFQPLLVGAVIATLCFSINLMSFFTDLFADKQVKHLQKLETQKVIQPFKLKDLKEFNGFYWIIILSFGINFGIYYPFVGNSTTIYKQKFGMNPKNTGDIQSLTYLMGLLCPVVGFMIKKYKKQQFIYLIISNILALLFFLFLLIHPGCQESCSEQLIVPIIILGLYIMIFPVVLVPAVANSSPLKLAGTAYGIAYAWENTTEAIIPYLGVGPLLQHSTIDATLLLFVGLSVFSLIISIVIHFWFLKNLRTQKQ